jgi:hypothetical protein
MNMRIVAFVIALTFGIGFTMPVRANDRPDDPFGNHTVELNGEAPLVSVWEFLRDQVLLDKAHFHSCLSKAKLLVRRYPPS